MLAGLIPSGGTEVESVPGLSGRFWWWPAVPGLLCLVDTSLQLFLFLHTASVCVCSHGFLISASSHLIRAAVIQCDHILANYICKSNFQIKSHSQARGVGTATSFSGGHNATHSHPPPPHTSLSAQACALRPTHPVPVSSQPPVLLLSSSPTLLWPR